MGSGLFVDVCWCEEEEEEEDMGGEKTEGLEVGGVV